MHGVHGRALRVDLADGTALSEEIPELVASRVLGGAGLASLLLHRFCPPRVEPLAAENPLVFATSPFVGTGITTASKIAVATKSPQTGVIGDSLSSSYLAIALKRTGFDALVVQGAAPAWSVLVVDDDRVSLRPAATLLGLDPAATADALRAEMGSGFRVAAIGVAGERGVRYAAISNDGRLAGRTGAGAVMGSKRLKAIAVRGTRLPAVADPRGLAAAARGLAERSLGPGTAKYREVGTAANVAFFDRMGVLPTRNFQSGRFAGADAIGGETLLLEHHTDKHGCAACTVGCEHRYRTRDGGPTTEVRLEYETLFALGSLCGVADPNAVLRAAARCDALGIDSMTTGATIAWAMECRERGIDLGVPADEIPAFGDGAALLRTIDAIGDRRGLGDLLAEGSRAAAALVGQGSEAWAMHVKGLELPGYDPRKLQTLALGLAVGTRGACHNRSSAYEVDFSDRLDPKSEATARAEAAAGAEDQAALLDSLTLCKFLRHTLHDVHEEAASLYTMVTGVPTAADDLRLAGERITNLKKLFNIAQGWTRADDTLPPRVLVDEGETTLLSRPWLDQMIAAYYRVRGWDEDGLIPAEHLERVGLADLVELAPVAAFAGR
ncbi:MAG: Tungsten-containing aldehyde:ferredoxin oxidoreductase [uncultured Thermomicrobiales bacterium]|uniref:Tungsten-containing aldehyde:ferredoxin oxidoreductase n=1 Tax=uncultured Thermomicrobiales bacterium TaxID=1645740 RepID=A0A6J4UYK6_9BACT|nr:MAG: Tungsten-containing aldehyde:ferredoxin oxidoreductase [uncultured Thermomicrobiales bacterium]